MSQVLPIGIGVYPAASFGDALLVARPGLPVLVMGKSPRGIDEVDPERHGLATQFRNAGCDVTRRHWEPDNSQLNFDLPPEIEALRWYHLNLGGLSVAVFKTIYARTVGPNECYGDPAKFSWLAAFEVELCRLHNRDGIAYAWGSIQVGCVDPLQFVTTFASINARAQAVCYHLYAKPRAARLEPDSEPWWARRPKLWFDQAKKSGVRFPPLLGGESGTFFPWHPTLNDNEIIGLEGQISAMLGGWRQLGMPIIGHCAFALGAEGQMGEQWNLSRNALELLNHANLQPGVDYRPPDPAVPAPRKEPALQDFTSPNHDGVRPTTTGCVVHATLGGTSGPQQELNATVSWFNDPASQVSAHAVVGPGHQVWRPVRPNLIAWHCRASNGSKRGIEMCKAHLGDAVLPEILDDAAHVIADWWLADRAAGVHWLLEWDTARGLAEHHEMPTNTDGHQDVGGPFNRTAFLAMVKAHAGQGEDMTPTQKAAVLDDLDFLWAYSEEAKIKLDPAESERVLHERIIGLKTTLGLNG